MRRNLSILRWTPTLGFILGLAVPAPAQSNRTVPHGTLVTAIGEDPALPLPAISDRSSDADIADQLFLRLAVLDPTMRTAGDNALKPMLARSWRRIDARTLLFDLDPRARWHDGTPVTARDVVFTWRLMTDSVVGKGRTILEPVEAVEAVGTRGVRVRFKRPFNEQAYVFAFNMQPLPAHLAEKIAPASLAASSFAAHPIGNGPYRFERRVPAQLVELRADPKFFLGAPGIARVIFRIVADASARTTLLLTGETDVMINLPQADIERVRALPSYRVFAVSSNQLVYASLNTRAPVDTSRPHPVLADRRVREALVLALDRQAMAANVYGPGTPVGDAAQSQLWGWITPRGITGRNLNLPLARARLAEAGWRDTDGDGTADRNGSALDLRLMYPNVSGPRRAMALQAQAMWKEAGIRVAIQAVDPAVFTQRRGAGDFDIEINGVNQDPTPSSLTQSWSCASAGRPGSNNRARWCDRTFDTLLLRAESATAPVPAYRRAMDRMAAEIPAIFLAAPVNRVAVHTRFQNVVVWPIKPWLSLWQWRIRPGAELARDR